MADMENAVKMADEALSNFRKVLADLREEHAKRVAPLWEELRDLGNLEHDRRWAQSIRRQIAQFEQSQRELERPIVEQMVRIESMIIRPFVISRADLPKDFPHG